MKLVADAKENFFKQVAVVEKVDKSNASFQLLKLKLLFYLLVLNDTGNAYELEIFVADLRKRDTLKEPDTLTNDNLLKDAIITMYISVSQSLGRIVSKKDTKTAEFFGYTKLDFQKIVKINELMPPFLAKHHDDIIHAFIARGESQLIKGSSAQFFRSQLGFVVPVKIYLDFALNQPKDFVTIGTLVKLNTPYDYLIFSRSGQVLGISEGLAMNLLMLSTRDGHKVPTGDYIINNINAFLLLPRVFKSILQKKRFVMKALAHSSLTRDLSDSEKKHRIVLSAQPFNAVKKFQSFLNKKYSS